MLGNACPYGGIIDWYDLKVYFGIGSVGRFEEANVSFDKSGWPHDSELFGIRNPVWMVDCCLLSTEQA